MLLVLGHTLRTTALLSVQAVWVPLTADIETEPGQHDACERQRRRAQNRAGRYSDPRYAGLALSPQRGALEKSLPIIEAPH